MANVTETKEVKQNKTKQTEPKDDDSFFEVPVMAADALVYLSKVLSGELGMTKHTAVSFRVDRGKLMIGVLPKVGHER